MRLQIAALAWAGLALAASTVSAATPGVRIENAAARVEVIPEARSSVSVAVHQVDGRLPRPTARVEGSTIVVDGGLRDRIGGCDTWDFGVHFGSAPNDPGEGPRTRSVRIRNVGPVNYNHLPLITVHVPLRSHVDASGAIWGTVGPSQALALSSDGCGGWRIGDVAGPLAVATSGSGDVYANRAGTLDARLEGSSSLKLSDVAGSATLALLASGEVKAGAVEGPLHAHLEGSGDVHLARVDGPIQAELQSSGAVQIAAGSAPHVSVDVAGSGDFRFSGTAGAVSAAVSGSGGVEIAHATGPVAKSVTGSGEVRVGR